MCLAFFVLTLMAYRYFAERFEANSHEPVLPTAPDSRPRREQGESLSRLAARDHQHLDLVELQRPPAPSPRGATPDVFDAEAGLGE